MLGGMAVDVVESPNHVANDMAIYVGEIYPQCGHRCRYIRGSMYPFPVLGRPERKLEMCASARFARRGAPPPAEGCFCVHWLSLVAPHASSLGLFSIGCLQPKIGSEIEER